MLALNILVKLSLNLHNISTQDLDQFGIAPRKIVTAKAFSDDKHSRKRQVQSSHHAIPGEAPLPDLIVPSQ